MATKSIEERAKDFACIGCEANKVGASCEHFHPSKRPHASVAYHHYITGAYQQDRIARAEEREKCIKAAQDAFCKLCCETCYNIHISSCYKGKAIRKAIEKGGEE